MRFVALSLLLLLSVSAPAGYAADDFVKRRNPDDVQWCQSAAAKSWILNQWNAQADRQISALRARQPNIGGQLPSNVATELGLKIARVEKSEGGFMPCVGSTNACNPIAGTHACHATVKLVEGSQITGTFYESPMHGLPPAIGFQSDAQRKASGF